MKINPGINPKIRAPAVVTASVFLLLCHAAQAQQVDVTKAPNVVDEGVHKSFAQEIGAGRGNALTPNSSIFLIQRDPFRSIRRGRELFQRKFSVEEGLGPIVGDGRGDINTQNKIGAGLADSCAGCHGRPRGSAGFGGDMATRPDSRDAPHLFGLGLKEMLADEITGDLREIRATALQTANRSGHAMTLRLVSKGIDFGHLTAFANGVVDASQVSGVDSDLRVRPFGFHGGTISIREFVVGGFQSALGMQADDPDLAVASAGGRVVTPSGMVLDGRLDRIEPPPSHDAALRFPDDDHVVNEIPESIVDHFEFYLLNYFRPAQYRVGESARAGRHLMQEARCTSCHVPDLVIRRDRRVADLDTVYDAERGVFNNLFATATLLLHAVDDGSGFPPLKAANLRPFVVRNIFTDFKRHDLGPAFHERNYDGTIRTQFLTIPLWGVGSTSPYGHDGRSINLHEVILRHGGEAQESRERYAHMSQEQQSRIVDFLQTLVLFPPDDTASTLNPANPNATGFPQSGHGSIKVQVLFNDPTDPE